MDYLNILSSRSLILFPDPASLPLKVAHHRTYSSSSSSSSIQTPPSTHLLLPPTPISIPITSLLYADTNTAYFLLHHIITCAAPPLSPGGTTGGIAALGKDTMKEAEVLVWKEIDRAKMFSRDLGERFKVEEKLGEEELRELAARWGLGLKDQDEEEEGDGDEASGMDGSSAISHRSDMSAVIA